FSLLAMSVESPWMLRTSLADTASQASQASSSAQFGLFNEIDPSPFWATTAARWPKMGLDLVTAGGVDCGVSTFGAASAEIDMAAGAAPSKGPAARVNFSEIGKITVDNDDSEAKNGRAT